MYKEHSETPGYQVLKPTMTVGGMTDNNQTLKNDEEMLLSCKEIMLDGRELSNCEINIKNANLILLWKEEFKMSIVQGFIYVTNLTSCSVSTS